MVSVEVILVSGRTAHQGVGLEAGKTTEIYFENTSFVELSEPDAKILSIEEMSPVEIFTEHGSVVVSLRVSAELPPGIAFLPNSPWANRLFDAETFGTGMPDLKGVKARIKPATGKSVLSLRELVSEMKKA
jgi:formylmethanofuran dehydrogenase subunit D